MFGLLLLKECQGCETSQTRLFTDSWTGMELCIECLIHVLPQTTFSPEDEGDNLRDLIKELHPDEEEE